MICRERDQWVCLSLKPSLHSYPLPLLLLDTFRLTFCFPLQRCDRKPTPVLITPVLCAVSLFSCLYVWLAEVNHTPTGFLALSRFSNSDCTCSRTKNCCLVPFILLKSSESSDNLWTCMLGFMCSC